MGWATRQLVSFEAVVLAAVYSNQIDILLPFLPVDATFLFAAASIPVGLWIIAREGIYVRGLLSFTAGILFLAWVATTYLWTPSRHNAPKTISYLAVFAVWFLIVGTIILAGNRERALRFLILHLPLALVFSLYGLYVYLTYGTFRLSGAFGEDAGRVYLSWGYMVSAGGAVAFTLAILARIGTQRQFLALGLWGLCVIFLLIGGGRGPLLSHLAICMIPLVVRTPLPVRGRLLVTHAQLVVLLIGLTLVGGVIYLLVSGQSTTTLARFTKLLAQANEDSNTIMGFNDRFVYFSSAYRFWTQAPVVGHGIGSWSILMYGFEKSTSYPHNIVLQIMCENGLVGLSLFSLFLLVSLRQINFARLRSDPILLCALLVAPTALLAAMFSGDIAGNRRIFLYFGLLALIPAFAAARSPAPTRRHHGTNHRGIDGTFDPRLGPTA